MYARALFEGYGFSSCTINPYMGGDSVQAFIKNRNQGAFVLAVTSNPGAKDFQYLKVRGKPLYECVIGRVKKWNTQENCGLVVGATRPRELKRIRSLVPDMPFLIPGVGAQGGDLHLAVRYGCDNKGEMAIINASRSIIYASQGEDFAEQARKAATAMREEMNHWREKYFTP
jgi:orotidine-5'-phosphate decarboxylase